MNNYKYLIDVSYITYFTSFSTFKRYVYQNDIPQSMQTEEFDPTIDPEFCHILMQNFHRNVILPIKKIFPIFQQKSLFFCLDCARKNIWRRAIYPEYKLNRDLNKTSQQTKFNLDRVFRYTYDNIIPRMCDEYQGYKIRCEYAQGDDIIAVLTNYFLKQNDTNKIIIVSCDKDMVQLYGDRVNIISADGIKRNPTDEISASTKIKNLDPISANDFLLYKIILGDSSDNIPNIKSGIGPKKAYNLMKDTQKLKKLLKQDVTIVDSFIRNKKLISMKQIPQNINNIILQMVENEITTKYQNNI